MVFFSSYIRRSNLLPPLLHGHDLYQAHEDVDEVELKADALVHGVLGSQATLRHACVVEDLLDVVEGEAHEDGETTVEPDVLSPCKGSESSCRQNHGCEAGECDKGHTGEKKMDDL